MGLLAAALLTAGCATALTPEHLAPSVAQVFGGLYASQQALLGRTDVHRGALQPLASCRRSGTSSDGPGEDWSCSVQYVDGGTAAVQSFEVTPKPDGCWTAFGPPGTQPAQLSAPVTGVQVRNPLGEFDGCLDTSWR